MEQNGNWGNKTKVLSSTIYCFTHKTKTRKHITQFWLVSVFFCFFTLGQNCDAYWFWSDEFYQFYGVEDCEGSKRIYKH